MRHSQKDFLKGSSKSAKKEKLFENELSSGKVGTLEIRLKQSFHDFLRKLYSGGHVLPLTP